MSGTDAEASDKIVLRYHDSLLQQSDVDLFGEARWINDVIIGFSLEYFEKHVFMLLSDSVEFIGPGTVQLIKSMETIWTPV
jgi:hypothetical protein